VTANDSCFSSVVLFPTGEPLHVAESKRCVFSRGHQRWTLHADCAISEPMEIPANVTLDGGGHTIFLTGDAERFESAAVRIHGGDVVNLTIDGSQLLPTAPAYFAAIALTAPGDVANTTVQNLDFHGDPHSAIGIEVVSFDSSAAQVRDVALENISGAGLLLTGNSQVTIKDVRISRVTAALQASGNVSVRVSGCTIDDAQIHVLAQNQACVRVDATSASGECIAEDDALIHHPAVTFIGAGDCEQGRRRAAALAAAPRNQLG
jgi:hypothetical protein